MMKKIVYISLVITLLSTLMASGQSYQQFLLQLLEKSPQMELYTARRSADSLLAKRGLNPEDPEVSYTHALNENLFGEFEFEQKFDFPTVYHQRNKIAGHKIDRVELEFMNARFELLLKASDAYNSAVYAKHMVALQAERVEHLRHVDSLAEVALKAGGTTIVERSMAGFMLSTALVDHRAAVSALESAVEMVRELGVEKIYVSAMQFPSYDFSGSREEFVNAAVHGDWIMAAQRVDSLIAQRELKLARSEWAPGIKIGYKMSGVAASRSHELMTGITLPLWQNRNNVKHSKALMRTAEAQLRVTERELRAKLVVLFGDYRASIEKAAEWSKVDIDGYQKLSEESMLSRGTTMMDYLQNLESVLDIQIQRLATNYQAAILGGQMALYLH